jgi:hypothetical protein
MAAIPMEKEREEQDQVEEAIAIVALLSNGWSSRRIPKASGAFQSLPGVWNVPRKKGFPTKVVTSFGEGGPLQGCRP